MCCCWERPTVDSRYLYWMLTLLSRRRRLQQFGRVQSVKPSEDDIITSLPVALSGPLPGCLALYYGSQCSSGQKQSWTLLSPNYVRRYTEANSLKWTMSKLTPEPTLPLGQSQLPVLLLLGSIILKSRRPLGSRPSAVSPVWKHWKKSKKCVYIATL